MPFPKAAEPSVQVPGRPPTFQRTSPSARPDFPEGGDRDGPMAVDFGGQET